MQVHHSLAVIADAHLHDLEADVGLAAADLAGGRASVITLADTARSTRVFNESGAALVAALDRLAARGIRIVALAGDYSDDGQLPSVAGAARIFADYERRHGMRFFALPGNHDVFASTGRHRTRRFIRADGGEAIVTSDPARLHGDVILNPAMACSGAPQAFEPMAAFGFLPRGDEIHWETPFGTSPGWGDRTYRLTGPDGERHDLVDASYLVEPAEGLWLLMLDANVFEPQAPEQGGGFSDPTSAGWTALLRVKPFLVDWIADVARRARAAGKHLVAVSHYPVVDPFHGTGADEASLMGRTAFIERTPAPEVGATLAGAGLRLHFSGHLHVDDVAALRGDEGALVNVAVPSPVGFPAAVKLVHLGEARIRIETLPLDDVPLDADVMAAYRREAGHRGHGFGRLLAARDHGDFLAAHLAHLVDRRYLKRDWPDGMRALVRAMSVYDLLAIAEGEATGRLEAPAVLSERRRDLDTRRRIEALARGLGKSAQALDETPLMDVVVDGYALRFGGEATWLGLSGDRRALLSALIARFSGLEDGEPDDIGVFFARLMRMTGRMIDGLPTRHIEIDPMTGAVTSLA